MSARINPGMVAPRPLVATADSLSARVSEFSGGYLRLPRLLPRVVVPDPPGPISAPALAQLHARTLSSTLTRPLVGGNRVDVLVDGPSTYAAMFAAIAGARDHVNLESYILEGQGPGESLAELL